MRTKGTGSNVGGVARGALWSRSLGALVLSSLLLVGCQPNGSKSLAIGRVDTAVLLQDDTEYQSLSIEYLREQTDVQQKFVESMKIASNDEAKQKAHAGYQQMQGELDQRWAARTEEFLSTRHEAISRTAEEIAQRKSIDIVIVDSQMYPTTEWGGVDITPDMQLSLSQTGSKPAPTSEPTSEENG